MTLNDNSFGSILDELFVAFNRENISYFLMRDYADFESVNNSSDVDVVIEERIRNWAHSIIINAGWKTPKHNINYYSHQQYYKWNGERVVKLDVIYGLYFGNGLYSMNCQENIFSHVEKMGPANIPSPADGLLIHICHLVYDKYEISPKNRIFLEYLTSKVTNEDEFVLISAKCLLSGEDSSTLRNVGSDLCNKRIVKRHSSFLVDIRWLYKKCLAHLFIKKTITVSLIGVDGVGKSTSVDALKCYYGDKVITQYMGFKLFQTGIAKKWYASNRRIPIIGFIADCIILPYEMRRRYVSALSQSKGIVLFDRYPWEIYDNSKGIARCVNYILFKLLFKRPDGVIYLHCSVETSLSRKSDIEDVESFRIMKRCFDNQYMKYPGALVVDTDINDINTVKNKTIEYVAILEKE